MRNLPMTLKDKRGTSFPLTVAVTLCLIIILCGISEYMRLMIITSGVRNAVQSAVISTVNDNYSSVYQGAREGYSGAYQLAGSSWVNSIDNGNIYERLDQTLGTKVNGGYHVKYAGNTVEYRLSSLSVSITNAPFAPSDHGESQKFLVDTVIILEVPVSFGGKVLPSLKINLKTQATYIPRY